MTAQIFRFVTHDRVEAFTALGWKPHKSLEGTHHGHTAALLEWPHRDRNPEEPVDER